MTDTVSIKTPQGAEIPVGLVSGEYQIGRSKRSKQLVPVYDERFINYLAALVRERPTKGFDCVVLTTGPRRSGKSTLDIQIAQKVDPKNFSIANVAFRVEEFNSILRTNPAADPPNGVYPQAILDEAGFDLFSQNWMEIVQRNLVRKFEVIGAKRQTVYLVLPHRMLLNRSFREGMVHLWINVRTLDGMRGFAEVREGLENIWKLDMFWKPLCAFTFPELTGDLWRDYTVKKTSFIEEVCGDSILGEKALPSRDLMAQRNKALRLCWETGDYRLMDLAIETGLDKSTISRIVKGRRSQATPV